MENINIVAVDDRIVLQHFMDNDFVQKTLAILQRHNTLCTLKTPEGRFNSENAAEILAQIDFSGTTYEIAEFTAGVLFDPTAMPMSGYDRQPIHKITYYSTDRQIEELLYKELHAIVKVVPFHNIPQFPLATGEISDYTIHKGRALKDLCDYLGCLPLKAIADKICDSCENDGIAKALQELGLI